MDKQLDTIEQKAGRFSKQMQDDEPPLENPNTKIHELEGLLSAWILTYPSFTDRNPKYAERFESARSLVSKLKKKVKESEKQQRAMSARRQSEEMNREAI